MGGRVWAVGLRAFAHSGVEGAPACIRIGAGVESLLASASSLLRRTRALVARASLCFSLSPSSRRRRRADLPFKRRCDAMPLLGPFGAAAL
eukprot:4904139-Alexandrium_andersonii.AAC.1